MDLVDIPLFGLGLHGKSPDVTANKLINAYYEFQKEPDGTRVAIYQTPGLSLFTSRGDTPWRGLHEFPGNSRLYGVHRGTFYEIDNAGIATARGTIGTTTGRVDIVDDGTRILVVDGTDGYGYDTSVPATPIAVIADADFPNTSSTAIFQGGRFLVDKTGTGQFYGSDLYSVTAWNGLNFATAESNPDNLIRVINYHGTVVLFGSFTTEFWANIGGAGFPYSRVVNQDLEYGLAARWSVGKFMGSYAFVAKNREGQVIVSMLEGYGIKRISNFELESMINNYSTVADASGFGYMYGGHPMYQLNFPSAGKSWVYDGSTDYWSELRYGDSGRHRAEIGVEFLGRTVVSDYENGNLYFVDDSATTDNGEAIITKLVGRHIKKNKKMLKLASLELGIEAGVGTVGVPNPVAGLRLSRDGGHTFGIQTFAPMGKTGEYTRRCIWRRLGRGRDIVPEVTISDNVKRVITDGVMMVEEGSN